MSLPVTFQLDRHIFKTTLYVGFISFIGMILVGLIVFIFDGKFFYLMHTKNLALVLISQFELVSIFMIPPFVASFVRPLSRTKSRLLIQGSIVLMLSSLIYLAVVTYLPRLEIYPFHERNVTTNAILVGVFLFINLALYLPSIFRKEAKS